MPNPFHSSGNAFSQPSDWIASGVGLAGQLHRRAQEGGAAFIVTGDVGSGKTTALRAYESSCFGAGDKVISLSLEGWNSLPNKDLRLYVLDRLITQLGRDAYNQATISLALPPRPWRTVPGPEEIVSTLSSMLIRAVPEGQKLLLSLDELQVPMEALSRAGNEDQREDFYEAIKQLVQAIAGQPIRLLFAATTLWSNAPTHVKDRVREISSQPLDAAEIQQFVEEGLKHTASDNPVQSSKDIGRKVQDRHPALSTMRQLHVLLWDAWEKAHRSGATKLTAIHLSTPAS